MAKKKSNPNGANQYLIDPRQTAFLAYYIDPASKTFSNALQSALKAGYEQEYAESITAKMPTWLAENIRKLKMLDKAERNLDKVLDLETIQDVIGAFGPVIDKKTKKRIRKENPNLLKIKIDVSKFIAERIGKTNYGGKDEVPSQTTNYTQIIINAPNGEKVRNQSDPQTVSSVASTS